MIGREGGREGRKVVKGAGEKKRRVVKRKEGERKRKSWIEMRSAE